MSYKNKIALVSADYKLCRRAAEKLAKDLDMTFACSMGIFDYFSAGKKPEELAKLTSREFVQSKADDTTMTLADSENSVIALSVNLITEKTLAELAKDCYIVAVDCALAKAADKLYNEALAKALGQTKKLLTERWKLIRASADLVLERVNRYDTVCNRTKEWLKEIVK